MPHAGVLIQADLGQAAIKAALAVMANNTPMTNNTLTSLTASHQAGPPTETPCTHKAPQSGQKKFSLEVAFTRVVI